MENFNENMVENVENVAEEIANVDSINGKVVLAVAAGVTGLVVGGVALYKKVLKPKLAEHKAKKDGITITQGVETDIEAENVEVVDESK